MAKKTKKEKIMAEYHRKMQQIAPTLSYKLPKMSSTPVASSASHENSDYSYVLSDLQRIAILTVLAICAQVVLWYMVRR